MPLLNLGFGNIIPADSIIAVVSPSSAPIKRLVSRASEDGKLANATDGRSVRAVVIHDSGDVTLSAIQPDTLAQRFI